MSAVRENRLAGVESYFFFRPEDTVADAIGNVNLASGGELYEGRGLGATIGIVTRGDGISGQGGLQLTAVARAARDNRVREDGAIGGKGDLRRVRKKASEVEEGRIRVDGNCGDGSGMEFRKREGASEK